MSAGRMLRPSCAALFVFGGKINLTENRNTLHNEAQVRLYDAEVGCNGIAAVVRCPETFGTWFLAGFRPEYLGRAWAGHTVSSRKKSTT